MRGYAAIALHAPTREPNVGGAARAASVYGAAMMVVGWRSYSRLSTDTLASHRHMPVLVVPNVLDVIPYDCIPVAVELWDDATPLPQYQHPERAFYVFGPENGSLGDEIAGRCRDRVMVPTRYCMNLAATVNVVLYDRMAKQGSAAA